MASGGGQYLNINQLRQNIKMWFASQQRCVTAEDYISRIYSMPPQYGKVAKTYIINRNLITPGYKDNPQALNLYVLGYNNQGKLTELNSITKYNLSKYLELYRIMTDAIDILNAYIINIKVKFDLVVRKEYNAQKIMLDCMLIIKQFFDIKK